MEQRTIRRFRTRIIWIHWLHMMAFAILAITGFLMFFNLTNINGGIQIRTVHRVAASFFVIIPIIYSIWDPRATLNFTKDAFHWNHDDIEWLKSSIKYYFAGKKDMPPQGRINGDQKLWQLIVIITSIVLVVSGLTLWFFKLKIPRLLYQGFLLTHSAAFIIVLVTFFWHFYLRTLHPDFDESLSSMIDGKVSESYSAEHYGKWHNRNSSQTNKD
jgi:formate dehydrogenase subunit gamma